MNYNTILLNLIDYYANLLIIQYHNLPKATATIKVLIKQILVNLLAMQIRDAFDWKTAVGNQLDIIGNWVGVSRFFDGQQFEFQPWFALIDWDKEPDNLQGGFSTFETFNDYGENQAGFLDYPNINPSKNKLNDYAFRWMIGLKIIKNSINHVTGEIDNTIWEYFEHRVYTTWEPHLLAYHYPEDLRQLFIVALDKGVLPCPTGCKVEIREIINA